MFVMLLNNQSVVTMPGLTKWIHLKEGNTPGRAWYFKYMIIRVRYLHTLKIEVDFRTVR